CTSQTGSFFPYPPATSVLPSGDKAKVGHCPSKPSSLCSSFPEGTSQSRITLSRYAAASILLSRDHARPPMIPSSTGNGVCCQDSTSHSLTPFAPAQANSRPLGDHATQVFPGMFVAMVWRSWPVAASQMCRGPSTKHDANCLLSGDHVR